MQDGILPDSPNAIAQTKDGYLWIGTNSGLLRFDGLRFTPWQDLTPNAPRLAGVYSLLGDSDGSLWIGTGNGLGN